GGNLRVVLGVVGRLLFVELCIYLPGLGVSVVYLPHSRRDLFCVLIVRLGLSARSGALRASVLSRGVEGLNPPLEVLTGSLILGMVRVTELPRVYLVYSGVIGLDSVKALSV